MGLLDKLMNRDVKYGDTLAEDLSNIAEAKKNRAVVVEYRGTQGQRYVVALNKSSEVAMIYDHADQLNMEARMLWGTDSVYSDFVDSAARISKASDTNRYHIFASTFSHSPLFVEYLTVIYRDYTVQKAYELGKAYDDYSTIAERTIFDIQEHDVKKMVFFNRTIAETEEEVAKVAQRVSAAGSRITLDSPTVGLYSLIVADAHGLDPQEDTDKLVIAAVEAEGQSLENVYTESTGFLWADVLERVARANERGWLKLIDPNTGEPVESFNSKPKPIPDYSEKSKLDAQETFATVSEGYGDTELEEFMSDEFQDSDEHLEPQNAEDLKYAAAIMARSDAEGDIRTQVFSNSSESGVELGSEQQDTEIQDTDTEGTTGPEDTELESTRYTNTADAALSGPFSGYGADSSSAGDVLRDTAPEEDAEAEDITELEDDDEYVDFGYSDAEDSVMGYSDDDYADIAEDEDEDEEGEPMSFADFLDSDHTGGEEVNAPTEDTDFEPNVATEKQGRDPLFPDEEWDPEEISDISVEEEKTYEVEGNAAQDSDTWGETGEDAEDPFTLSYEDSDVEDSAEDTEDIESARDVRQGELTEAQKRIYREERRRSKQLPVIDPGEVSTFSMASEADDQDENFRFGGKKPAREDFSAAFEDLIREKHRAQSRLDSIPSMEKTYRDELRHLKADLADAEREIADLDEKLDKARIAREEAVMEFDRISSYLDERHSAAVKARHRSSHVSILLEKLETERDFYANSVKSADFALEQAKQKKPMAVDALLGSLDEEPAEGDEPAEQDHSTGDDKADTEDAEDTEGTVGTEDSASGEGAKNGETEGAIDAEGEEESTEESAPEKSAPTLDAMVSAMEHEGGGVIYSAEAERNKFRGAYIEPASEKVRGESQDEPGNSQKDIDSETEDSEIVEEPEK